MNSEIIIAYLSVSGLLIAAAYVVYRLLLAGSKMPGLNRSVIMAVYAASLLAPLAIVFSNETVADGANYDEPTETVVTTNLADAESSTGNKYDRNTILPEETAESHQPFTLPTDMAGIVLLAGVAGSLLTAARFIWGVASITKLCVNGHQRRYGRLRIVITDNNRIAPFSWLNTIVISRNDFSCDGIMIIEHEFSHIRHRHFVDLTVSRIFCIIMWWNPAVWLLNSELRAVHEYQADAGVLSRGRRATDYQMLLVKKAAGTRMPAVVSSLSQGKLKTRFLMMRREKAGLGTRLRAAAIIPVITIATMAAGFTEAGNRLREIAPDESVDESSDLRFHVARQQEMLPTVENDQTGLTANENIADSQEPEHDKSDETAENSDADGEKFSHTETELPDTTYNNFAQTVEHNDRSADSDDSDEVQWAEIISTEVISGNIYEEIESIRRDAYDELMKETQRKMTEARRKQQENIKAHQQEIKRWQQETQRRQQEAIRRQTRNIRTGETSSYATEAEDQNVKGIFASLDNRGGATNVKVLIKSEKPVTTVGSAMVMINGRRYPTKVKNVKQADRQDDSYVTEVHLATRELNTFSRKDYVTLITDQGTAKINIRYK